MVRNQITNFRNSATPFLPGITALAFGARGGLLAVRRSRVDRNRDRCGERGLAVQRMRRHHIERRE